MTFLPIVERELRVAARKRSTAWSRLIAALLALLIASGFLTMTLALEMGSSRFGTGLFGTLTWMALAASLGTGLFFTADTLSEEKREGTLGFLFLTDLRGYDIVGGKLLATSLRGFYGLLALFPILAITLLMGGVTGLQFWKSALALINALFCSLAAGLFVSSFCRDSQRAMGGTFLFVILICAGGPIADSILGMSRGTGFRPWVSLLSPVYVFWVSSAWGRTAFWTGLAASHLFGWGCFALACILAPRTWQQRGSSVPGATARWRYSWKYGRADVRAAQRNKLMGLDPVLWLASRERWQAVAIWVVVLLLLALFAGLVSILPPMMWILWAQASALIVVMLYLWAASQACRFNVEAKKSGLLELLLVSPLDGRAIVSGQWGALRRTFGFPVLLLVGLQLVGTFFAQSASYSAMGAATQGFTPSFMLSVVSAAAGALSTVANLAALMWFGMWMGLTSKNASTATLKTVVFVQVFPWLGITFASTSIAGLLMVGRVMRSGAPSNSAIITFPLVLAGLSAVLTLAKDAAFFTWSRKRLYSNFRDEAAQLTGGRRYGTPITLASPLPPVIPAQP